MDNENMVIQELRILQAEMREMRSELRKFAEMSVVSRNDIKWLRSSGGAIITIISSIMAILATGAIRLLTRL